MAAAGGDRIVVQEFCPLADSIEWELGQRYWQERGAQAFLGDARPVPYIVNNDGTLSRNAAEVFFASLAAAEKIGPLPEQLFTLELGIGVGLFARYFLEALRDLCLAHGKDYYDRLCYIAGDRSEPMLRDACRQGIFAHHPGRYLLRYVDALQPEAGLSRDVALARAGPRPLWAVFLNYVIDCLPVAVLEVDDTEVRQLHVRTCLARGVQLREHTDLTAEQLAQRAQSPDPTVRQELREVAGLFASEYAYRPVNIEEIPYGDFAAGFARRWSRRVLHNYGALQSLVRLLDLLHEHGFILINDYGQTQLTRGEEYEHQRFSGSTSMGLNFPLLKAFFAEAHPCQWVQPFTDTEHIHPRLLGHRPAYETVLRFHDCFGQIAYDRTQEPAVRARELAQVGRLDAAAASYRQALQRQPSNWVLLNEVALFLTFALRDARSGTDLAKLAIGLNPISAELWDTLGDCLFEGGRVDEARAAYRRAVQLNPSDVRARYSLAWAHARHKDYAAALHHIAEGLALDQAGAYRERLLAKQQEVLALLAQRQQQEALRLANRVSTAAGKATRTEDRGSRTEDRGSRIENRGR